MDDNEKSYYSEHVMIAIVTNVFWLAILILTIVFFRTEIRNGLNSLNSVDIAGSHLKLSDRDKAIKSYTALSNIFVDMLSNEDYTKFIDLLSVSHAQQLNKFLRLYLDEVQSENLNRALVKNVAYILYRKGNTVESLDLYKTVLKKISDSPDLREYYGWVLLDANPGEAKGQFDTLIEQYPGQDRFKYDRARASVKLRKFDAAVTDLTSCLDAEYLGDGMRECIDELSKRQPDDGNKLLESHTKLVARTYNRALVGIKSRDFDAAAVDLNVCLDHGYLGDNMREWIDELSKGKPEDGNKLMAKYNKLVASRQRETEVKAEK